MFLTQCIVFYLYSSAKPIYISNHIPTNHAKINFDALSIINIEIVYIYHVQLPLIKQTSNPHVWSTVCLRKIYIIKIYYQQFQFRVNSFNIKVNIVILSNSN